MRQALSNTEYLQIELSRVHLEAVSADRARVAHNRARVAHLDKVGWFKHWAELVQINHRRPR